MAKKKKNAGKSAPEARIAQVCAPEAGMTATGTATAGTVTVAYNSPRGLVFTTGAKRIQINGNNAHLIGKEKGIIPVGRYGYTRIPAEDWDAVVKTYGSMAIFKSGLIFVEKSKDRAEDRAEEQSDARHGLEPVDTEKTATEEATVEA